MTSLTNFTEIPVVDVSGLFGTPSERSDVAEALGRAAREIGFLYVIGSGIDQSLFEEVLAVTEQFFAFPLERKMAVYIGNSTNHRGYVPTGEEGGYVSELPDDKRPDDLKEAFDLSLELPADDPEFLAGKPMLGPNQWPDIPGMKETVNRYYDAVISFGKVLLQGFALALGEPVDRFDEFVTRAPSQLRLIHYPLDIQATDAIGIGAHTDFEVFTLLKSTKPGLEVLNGAGEWIDVPPMEGAFVVNIGDMLEIWSNGTFTSTTHRVRKVAEERYAFPLFFNVDYDVLVAPLGRFVRADGSNKLPLKAGEHLCAHGPGVPLSAEASRGGRDHDARGMGGEELLRSRGRARPRGERRGGPHSRHVVIPAEFRGGWVRNGVAVGGAEMTEPAVVWWLQAGSAYCDLRLPHDGVDQVMCFAGTTTWDGLRLTWHREVELDPSLSEDVGDVGWDGPDLIETGSVGSAGAEIGYVERWQRLPGSDHDLLALHCDGGRIVRTGRYALTILDGCQSGGDFAAVAWRLENDDWAARFSWPPDAVAPAPPADIPRKGETVVLRDGSEWIIDER